MQQEDALVSITSHHDNPIKIERDLDVKRSVQALTPSAAALARKAAEATSDKRDEDWDIIPHPILEPAAPSLRQFEEPRTAPVAVTRNPIAGKQVHEVASTMQSIVHGRLVFHVQSVEVRQDRGWISPGCTCTN